MYSVYCMTSAFQHRPNLVNDYVNKPHKRFTLSPRALHSRTSLQSRSASYPPAQQSILPAIPYASFHACYMTSPSQPHSQAEALHRLVRRQAVPARVASLRHVAFDTSLHQLPCHAYIQRMFLNSARESHQFPFTLCQHPEVFCSLPVPLSTFTSKLA